MGRVSKVWMLQRKLKALRKKAQKSEIKPPFRCPLCFKDTLFIEKRKRDIFVRIYCTKCKLGELMPNHPSFSVVDYYAFLCDYWLRLNPAYVEQYGNQYKVPVFKYQSWQLTKHQIKFLQEKVSFGEIVIE